VGFRLKSGQSVSSEVRRIVLRQLDLAASELVSVGDPESDEAVHDARRRVKKIRAIIRLVRPVLDKPFRSDPDLRRVSQMLAPVADGKGVIDTLTGLLHRYRKQLPRKTAAAIRSDLIAREKQIDRKAARDGVLQEAKKTLRQERDRVKRWRLTADGFRAIEPGLKESVRRAREGMVAAWLHPTAANHHSWRRHVKNHWFHVRLLEAHCDNRLQPYQRQLEALDGVLGEYHNLVLLHDVLMGDSTLSRKEVARCLRIVERYQRALRRNAQVLGMRVYSEKPRRFVRRVKHLWDATT
jgi:CHAD domain-containing protein